MRKWQQANLCLGASAVLFLLAMAAYSRGASSFWYYTAQAALIGSVADWFAVSALFGRPLGIPWHTDLIVRHREELIQGMCRIMVERLVRPQWWENLVQIWDPMQLLAEKWRVPMIREYVLRQVRIRFDAWWETVDPLVYVPTVAAYIRKRLSEWEWNHLLEREDIRRDGIRILTVWGANHFATCLKQPSAQDELQFQMKILVRQHTTGFWATFGRKMGEFTGTLDYKEMADSVRVALEEILSRLADPTTNIHQKWIDSVDKVLAESLIEGEYRETWQGWRAEWTESLPLEETLAAIYQKMSTRWMIRDEVGTKWSEGVSGIVERVIDSFFARTEMMAALSEKIRSYMVRFGQSEHHRIGIVAASVLRAYSGEQLNEFVRSKVEDELAKIRINGAVVGAIIGAGVWLLLEYGYRFLLYYVPF